MANENRVLSEVAARRQEQIAKGYDAAHDDEHADGSIARAAAAYAAVAGDDVANANELYPWIGNVPKVNSKRDAMVHAAALCVAEIERMDRASSPLSRQNASQTACTWPNCDQPSGHDYCYDHCLDAAGSPTVTRPQRCDGADDLEHLDGMLDDRERG